VPLPRAAPAVVSAPRLRVGCPCGWRGYRVNVHSRPCPACGADPDKIEALWPAGQGPGPTVYLLHFRFPDGPPGGFHARHYSGATRDLPQRLRAHRLGHGARLVEAAVAVGAHVELARVWRVPLSFERRLKKRTGRPSGRTRSGATCRGAASSLRRLCPTCVGPAAWGRYAEATVRAGYRDQREQLAGERAARRARRERWAAERAAGVWDPVAAWPAEWDRLFPAAGRVVA
jgi:hypothetical protein